MSKNSKELRPTQEEKDDEAGFENSNYALKKQMIEKQKEDVEDIGEAGGLIIF